MPSFALTPHLELIVGRNPRFPMLPYCNSLLIRDEVTALVDTCAGPELLPLAEARQVELLVHTHCHPDHVNYDYLFPGVPVAVPTYAAEAIRSLPAFLAYSGFGLLGQAVGGYCARELGWPAWEYHSTFGDGDVLAFGRTRLVALHAPGHCVDHTLLWHEASGTLLCTDIDLSPFGPWYGNPGSDIDQFEASLDLVRRLQPRVLATSHSPAPVDREIPQRLDAYQAVFARRDRRLLDLLAEPLTLDEVVDRHPIFRSYPHPEVLVRHFERMMVDKHLQRLLRRGELEREEGGRYLGRAKA